MSLPCAQSMLGFDLDFLLEPSNNNVDCQILHNQKQAENTAFSFGNSDTVIQSSTISQQKNTNVGRNKKSDVNFLKRKLISTDSLLRIYQEKCTQVANIEQILLDTNVTCREVCIERDTVRQNCESLEKEFDKLQNHAQELERKLLEKEHIQAATESHTHQLQQLVKEYDIQIESFKAGKASSKATIKDLEKRVAVLTKYNEETTTHLCQIADIVASKRALSHGDKFLMSKYLKLKKKRDAANEKINPAKDDNDADICEEFLSDTDGSTDNKEQVMSPPLLPLKIQVIQKSELKKDYADADPDLTIEITSVDTGRGSSLAFSDSDTLYSPEYYINSPTTMFKHKAKLIDVSTSPLPWRKQLEDRATSPIPNEIDTSQKMLEKNTAKAFKSVDQALSPVRFSLPWMKQLEDKATSPIANGIDTSQKMGEKNTVITLKSVDKALSPVRFSSVSNIDGIEPLSTTSELTTSENHRYLDSDNIDGEVEMILNNMKLRGGLITPIPQTPARSHGARSRTNNEHFREAPTYGNNNSISDLNKFAKVLLVLSQIVKDLAKNREDVVSKLDDMAKDLFGISEVDDESCNKMSKLINNIEPDVPYQNTPRVIIDSPEPNELNEVTSLEGEQECLNSNQLLTKTKITPSVQVENDRGRQKCVHSNSSQNSCTKTNISDKIQFENDRNDQLESATNQDKNDNHIEVDTSSSSVNKDMKKVSKAKKLTRLEKLRKNLIPKSKIRDITPPRILRSRTKPHPITVSRKNTNNAESSAPLNNMDVYEKAVKVMAEIKAKNKTIKPKMITKSKKKLAVEVPRHKDDILKLTNEENNVRVKTAKLKEVSSELKNGDVHIPETRNRNSVSNEPNVAPTSIEKTPRRKSDSYEINNIISKSRKKYPSLSLDKDIVIVLSRSELKEKIEITKKNIVKTEEVAKTTPAHIVGSLKRVCNENLEPAGNKRILRSSIRTSIDSEKNNNERKTCNRNTGNRPLTPKEVCESGLRKLGSGGSFRPNIICSELMNKSDTSGSPKQNSESAVTGNDLVSYNDLDIFNDEPTPPPPKKQRCLEYATNTILNPQKSILCKMIDIHGVTKIKTSSKKIPEATVMAINTQITESIEHIIQLPPMETLDAMKKMIKDLQKWTFKEFLAGLMTYLMDPTRRLELFNKVNVPPAPPMTKAEQVLLYIVTRISWDNVDTVDSVLSQIEYTLFRLNQTPELKVVESMAHFYAVLCRYIKAKNRLRIFVFDAMYCMSYSAVALIKQCIEVWMHILPLAHMGAAKSTLVTCLVYLLHFYKCDDSENKVQDMRNILKQKYFFQVTDWDETKILDMFKNAILELKDNAVEQKMLRLALILLAKRNGTKWCQNKIIKCMLMPIITEEKVSERAKAFCISILGALFKPYPENMKVHCEIAVNQLMDMLDKKPSPVLEEAIYTSLILLSKHNQNRVIQSLLSWQPKQLSPYMENVLINYVRDKPVRVWKAILGKVSLVK